MVIFLNFILLIHLEVCYPRTRNILSVLHFSIAFF